MVLYKIEDFDPNYRNHFQNDNVKGYDVYSDINNEKVGNVNNILVEERGRIRYLGVDTGFWGIGKEVLLPIGRSRIDDNAKRVYAKGLTKEQVNKLPSFDNLQRVDYDYEELVREIYRAPIVETPLETPTPVEASLPLEASAPLDIPPAPPAYLEPRQKPVAEPVTPRPIYQEEPVVQPIVRPVYNRETYNYEHEPHLYEMNDRDHQTLKLYEERLIANRYREKTGEVTVGKHVETETARVVVPVERERVVIERTTPTDSGKVVPPDKADFRDREIAHLDIYEETADVQKQAVVREEVNITKVVEHDTVEAQERVRREELDINTDKQIQERRS
jgi:uncharacterized protein (TIGR02271 family)